MVVVLSVFGTRPEAIKMAPVIKELSRRDLVKSIVCMTGQHREIVTPILDLFGINPEYNLNVMEQNQTLSSLTSNLLSRLGPVVEGTKPDWVLAQGDTTSLLATALISYYHKVKFGHVEAGLRSHDKYRPYPEEMNRRLADKLADAFFAPTEENRQTLINEGVPDEQILVTGNTVIDALTELIDLPYDWQTSPLANLPTNKKIIVVTCHRRESFGAPLQEICLAIRDLAVRFPHYHIVYPVHVNPIVRKTVGETLSRRANLSLIEPLDYLSMINLMKRSKLILTDSGGIEEEAVSLGIPVLVMRDITDRPEVLETGAARLVGTRREQIVDHTTQVLTNTSAYASMTNHANPYGDGKAATRIVSYLLDQSD
ncbi:MAG: UDP-N-acetylglucosamine 2-epimerase (non-hydrolyzing) [Candidatus Bathyarchaeia archaeon]|jgi:UDP-N-acetylglucosamine 2-epimerase (non-hydrolysing)